MNVSSWGILEGRRFGMRVAALAFCVTVTAALAGCAGGFAAPTAGTSAAGTPSASASSAESTADTAAGSAADTAAGTAAAEDFPVVGDPSTAARQILVMNETGAEITSVKVGVAGVPDEPHALAIGKTWAPGAAAQLCLPADDAALLNLEVSTGNAIYSLREVDFHAMEAAVIELDGETLRIRPLAARR